MMAWLRLYDELLDDPKVQRLSGDDFKAWINLLCLARRHDGFLPDEEAITFALRIDRIACRSLLDRLAIASLIETIKGGPNGSRIAPHGWTKRQYKTDTSTERVKRYRKRSKERSEPLLETAPDTDTDTDTDIPEDKSSGDELHILDAEAVMWRHGRLYLQSQGISGSRIGNLLGQWKRDFGPEATIIALGKAQREGAIDCVSFITKCLKTNRPEEGYDPERITV